MTHEEKLNRYIEVCKRAWKDMVANDNWEWLDEPFELPSDEPQK